MNLGYGIILSMKSAENHFQIQEEILLAKQSRKEGNEGRARVCARRAAGAAAGSYLTRQGLTNKTENAYLSLQTLGQMENFPDRIQIAINRLIQRVDGNYQLPPGIDLIHEADIVIQFLEIGQTGN